MNGMLGETLAVSGGVTSLAPWLLAAYAIRRGWRVNTTPEKKPVLPQDTATPAVPETPAGVAVPAGANGAAG